MRPFPIVSAAVLGLALALAATAARAGDGPARLEAFLDGLQSLHATFEQRLFDDSRGTLETSHGTLRVIRPARFRWDYVEPYPQLIVSDGERVWIYDEDLEQVTVQPVGDALGGTPAMLLSSGRPIGESFRVKDLGEEGGVSWVGLEPRAEEASFTEIRIGFDGERFAHMELVDGFGQLTRLDLSDVSRNPVLDPNLFRFDPPLGVEIVESLR